MSRLVGAIRWGCLRKSVKSCARRLAFGYLCSRPKGETGMRRSSETGNPVRRRLSPDLQRNVMRGAGVAMGRGLRGPRLRRAGRQVWAGEPSARPRRRRSARCPETPPAGVQAHASRPDRRDVVRPGHRAACLAWWPITEAWRAGSQPLAQGFTLFRRRNRPLSGGGVKQTDPEPAGEGLGGFSSCRNAR